MTAHYYPLIRNRPRRRRIWKKLTIVSFVACLPTIRLSSQAVCHQDWRSSWTQEHFLEWLHDSCCGQISIQSSSQLPLDLNFAILTTFLLQKLWCPISLFRFSVLEHIFLLQPRSFILVIAQRQISWPPAYKSEIIMPLLFDYLTLYFCVYVT